MGSECTAEFSSSAVSSRSTTTDSTASSVMTIFASAILTGSAATSFSVCSSIGRTTSLSAETSSEGVDVRFLKLVKKYMSTARLSSGVYSTDTTSL